MPPDAGCDPPEWEDPIVAEVHRIRAEILAEFNGDVDAYFKYVQGIEEENRRRGLKQYGDPSAKIDKDVEPDAALTHGSEGPGQQSAG